MRLQKLWVNDPNFVIEYYIFMFDLVITFDRNVFIHNN